MNNKQPPPPPLTAVLDFFASVKLSIFLLLTVAAASVIGTLIPQEGMAEIHHPMYSPFLDAVFIKLGFFNVYKAWWFQLLLGLLALNLVVCTLKRLPITWKLVTGVTPGFSRGKFKSIKEKHEIKLNMPAQKARDAVLDVVSSRFKTVKAAEDEDGYTVYAEKGRWTRMGFYVIHLSFLLILAGALLGSLFGYSGSLNLEEGQTSQTVEVGVDRQRRDLPFAVKCERFEVKYYEGRDSVSEFTSDVTITEPGKAPWRTFIRVNHPLRLHGVSLYQASYGVSHYSGLVNVSFKNLETGEKHIVPVPISAQPTALPWDKGMIMIPSFTASLRSRDGHNMGPAVRMHIFPQEGKPEVMFMPVGRPEFARDVMGLEMAVLEGEEIVPVYYTGLKVTKDPGVWVVYSGFILILLGCMVTFFMAHQQLYIKIVPSGSGASVELGGAANKNSQGFEERVRRIAGRLEKKE
ncbi:cytochrome c biogenesis protein [Desulfatibacillum alkenivorans DSM 16219]|uniref:Cytochrome c biogenesis protein n=1 Tax=Desulfatibacillum alkenivorans DSM 16219 TaxID=1121393 RepID=A0A1M6XQU9_9BACT|nr:cytochrome c biogenesis protein ResB [Desulfatibacillum alkenivorans]SHL08293.1 cytochrome c biogenesis protein [Desulfatibacillum alkenivorans DSM 16219]